MKLLTKNVESARAYMRSIWPTLVEFALSPSDKQDKIREENSWVLLLDDTEYSRLSLDKRAVLEREPGRILFYPSIITGIVRYKNPDTWLDAGVLALETFVPGPQFRVNAAREELA